MKKLVKGFASVILASIIFVVGCKPPTSTSEPSTGGSKPTGQSKITVTVKGDERIDLSSLLPIKKTSGTAWSDIKAEIEGKIKPSAAWEKYWNKGDYAVYEWRLGDENGEKITDDRTFTEDATVYAVSNYVKWKIVNNELTGYDGSKPRGKIIIPNSVTSIGYSAFEGCKSLTTIEIPASVKSIGQSAFKECESLTTIEIPAGVTSIRISAFYDCKSLKTIEIPAGVTSIEGSTFSGCTALKSINIPAGVEWIGERTFECCSALSSITIPESVTSIGNNAFKDCKNLSSITLPKDLAAIRNRAFSGCKRLASIEIPANVTLIEPEAFSYCSSLKSITIPASVTDIELSIFDGCTVLETVHFDDKKGWAVYSDRMCKNKVTDIAESDLDDTKEAKTLLTDTHKDKYWKKK